MGDYGYVAAVEAWKCEDATYSGELVARKTAHNARLAEESIDGGVT